MMEWFRLIWKRANGAKNTTRHAAALQQKYLNAMQEMNQMRDRFIRQSERHQIHMVERIVRDFLPVVDSIQRALEAEDAQDNPWLEGFEKTYAQFQQVLQKYEVHPTPGAGAKFDPVWHEAVSVRPSDQHDDGIILEVVEQGYRMNGRLLRAGKVVVAKNPN
jgi:molecular chaperone GrpE